MFFKLINKHQFISGFVAGYIVFGRGLKKLINTRMTIIKIVMPDDDIIPSEDNKQDTEEN